MNDNQQPPTIDVHNTPDKQGKFPISISHTIQHLRQQQIGNLDMVNSNSNNNNMYTKNNPNLKMDSYNPKNGSHTDRSKMLHAPGSFVSGNFASDVNNFERSMPIPWDYSEYRQTNHDYMNKNGNAYMIYDGYGNYNVKFDENYNQNGNVIYQDSYDQNFHNYQKMQRQQRQQPGPTHGYGRHKRQFQRTSTSRFHPTKNSHNENVDYGLQYSYNHS